MSEEHVVFVLVPSKYNHYRCAFPGCPALRYGDKVEGSHVHHESNRVLMDEELQRVRASIDKIVNGIDSIQDRDLRATVFAIYEAHRAQKGVYEIAAEMGLRLPLSPPSSYLSNRLHTWLECAAQNGTLGPFPVTVDPELPTCKRCHGKSEPEWRALLVDTFRAMINNQKARDKRSASDQSEPNQVHSSEASSAETHPLLKPLRKQFRRDQRMRLDLKSLTKKQQTHQRRMFELREVMDKLSSETLRDWVAKETASGDREKLSNRQTHIRQPFYIWKAALHAAWDSIRTRIIRIGGELTYHDLVRLQLLETCFWCGQRFPNGDVLRFDRIQNEFQYGADNVLPTCNDCNQMRGKKPVDQFLHHCQRVYEFKFCNIAAVDGPVEHHQAFGAWRNDVQFGRRGKAVNLSCEDWLTLWSEPCFYCGKPKSCGIDRVDSKVRTYSQSNCVSCCGWCNLLKMDLEQPDFLRKVRQIAEAEPKLPESRSAQIFSCLTGFV